MRCAVSQGPNLSAAVAIIGAHQARLEECIVLSSGDAVYASWCTVTISHCYLSCARPGSIPAGDPFTPSTVITNEGHVVISRSYVGTGDLSGNAAAIKAAGPHDSIRLVSCMGQGPCSLHFHICAPALALCIPS